MANIPKSGFPEKSLWSKTIIAKFDDAHFGDNSFLYEIIFIYTNKQITIYETDF